MGARELKPSELRRICDPEKFDFETTTELEPLAETLGQSRARDAFEFGIGIEDEGYNIFAHGASGLGKLTVVRRFLERKAAERPRPNDLCYVSNFEAEHRPRLLCLPAGRGHELQQEMDGLLMDLGTALGSAFEGEQYQTRRQVIEEGLKDRQEKAVAEVGEEASKSDLTLMRTPMGMVFAPLHDGEVLTPDEFSKLPQEEQDKLQKAIEGFQEELQKISRQIPRWQREAREQLRELNREISRFAIKPLLDELRERYEGLDELLEHFEAVERDILKQTQSLLSDEGDSVAQKIRELMSSGEGEGEQILSRYRVNVLVDHAETEGAPVVFEDNPTFGSLVGRIEHRAKMGALVTDFSLIKSGSLHQANGGYLLVEARKLLSHAYAWEGLKRALQSHQLKIESVGQALNMASTYTLEPEPAPLDVKVVIVGEPRLYYLLSHHDPDFGKLFKVMADFEERIDRDDEGRTGFARLVAGLLERHELPPFDRGGVARVLEAASRRVDDSEKLSIHIDHILDLLRESAFWARSDERELVSAQDVQKALDARDTRTDRYRLLVQEQILRGTLLVDTEGTAVGQLNGLSVLMLGETRFGRPNRITARVRLGKGEMIDIEREVELGGPLHSKGVLILSSFLGARYAAERPLSLTASLVFEQSYGGVDGDSASSAELYALLSALSDLPLAQSLAVTGSVNQYGEVQAIGGVNEKIEGFFDICNARGLTGEQGVLIPVSNIKHLMLRPEVVRAVEEGKFRVYPVKTIDEGIELLTGTPAGEGDETGAFPEGSVNYRVAARLGRFADIWQEISSSSRVEP